MKRDRNPKHRPKRRPRRRQVLTPQTVTGVCAWCGKRIPEDEEVFTVTLRKLPGIDTGQGGIVIEVPVDESRTLYGLAVTEDSQAKKEGVNMVFSACSETCGRALQKELLLYAGRMWVAEGRGEPETEPDLDD